MKRFTSLLFSFVFLSALMAQENPFEEYDYQPQMATMSGGKYKEFHDRDTIVRIGNLVYNTKSEKIIGFEQEDTVVSEATMAVDVVSRWISPDPLEHKFPSWSPYNFGTGNPIYFIDPDGRAAISFDGGKKLGPNQDPGVESTGNHTDNVVNNTTTSRNSNSISVTNTSSGQFGGTYSTTSTISGSPSNVNNVSNKSAEVLASSMRESSTSEVRVTSTQRTPEQQASAMYNNAINKGADSQYRLYGSGGDQVIETFESYGPDWCCTRSETVSAMTTKIKLIGATNVSRHAADPSRLNVIDLSTRSLGGNAKPFHISLSGNQGVSKLLTPFNSSDPAFHVEIPQ